MTQSRQVFSRSYAEARRKFIEAAGAAGLRVESHLHPRKGIEGEDLAIDVALDRSADARRLLIVSSGCHGVEGYCGSGVQVAALHDEQWRAQARERGVSVLYLHALNPYGFSHFRRATHENIDLNRNFHDFTKPLPANPGYAELHPLLLPATWPPDDATRLAIGRFVATRGERALQAVVSRGQHEFADGLFFGGVRPSWSNDTLRMILRSHAAGSARIAWIDLHTGLGPNGVGERILAAADDAATLARARAWWDGGGATPVTSITDGSSTSAFVTGQLWTSVRDECPQAEYTGIALEYGTEPAMEVMDALRGDHWLACHPEAAPELAGAIRARMFKAFYTDTPAWRQRVLSQAMEALTQATAGLAG